METFNKSEWRTLVIGGLVILGFGALVWQHASTDTMSAAKTTNNPTTSMTEVKGDISTDKRIQIVDTKVGTGAEAKSGMHVTVKYAGTFTNGKSFDSGTIDFDLGAGKVIKGWDVGIEGMKVGGQRHLVILPELGYGAQTVGPIPANSTLVFDVELISVK